ncbi:MAG: efflux transporter outer membrane subunit [Planctomycetes bacterium]|nr:efflux transporter outer membrane subunit [Planctomycetota bacterium]
MEGRNGRPAASRFEPESGPGHSAGAKFRAMLAVRRSHWLLALTLAGSGCRVGPDYAGPTADEPLPERFRDADDPAFHGDPAALRRWWAVFDDELLTALIDKAVADNLDLRVALARVSEARARVGIARAGGAPQVGIGAGVEQARDLSTGFATRTRATAGLDASWEIDVFGRIARGVEAATAEYQATAEDRRDVQVSLVAEVARAYLSVRALQERLAAAASNIESQREILALTETRKRDGLASGLDVSQARQVLASSEAAVPPLRIALAREINTIAVLVGEHPRELHGRLSEPRPIPVPPASIAVGVPAELVRQRPDIRAAERRLAAQTARVGVATAELYPSFSIDGSLGLQSLGGNLLDAGSRSLALGPSMRWNLFTAGRVRNQIKVEDARVEQTLLLYERAVLSALEEVESAMTAFTEQRVRVDAVETAAEASRETLRLATRLYREGLIGFQEVLDAQRQVFANESSVAEARGLGATASVQLYRALGGGWDPDEETLRDGAPADGAGSEEAPNDG